MAMKRGCLLVILAVFILSSVPTYADQAPEEILKAIVKIRSIIPQDGHTAGTLGTEREGYGVLIDAKGYIVTISYLIVEAETIKVVGPEDQLINATFAGYDPDTGFGLLRTDQPLSAEPMKLGESSKLNEGDRVLVAGSGGKESAMGARVIARKELTASWEYFLEDAIFTAPPYPNYGGAALIGRDGRLLGIGSLLTQISLQGVGTIPCNMFVPIDLLTPILSDLISTGRSGKAPRPWLGISAEEDQGRVFIIRVTSGGPAERAGLKPGDLIVNVNGKAVNGLIDFYHKVWGLGPAGIEVLLSILRGSQIQDITVRSADRYPFLLPKPKEMLKEGH
ncbi:MAG: S1C family serine protease [Thermodesulfobacteriota bacterium]